MMQIIAGTPQIKLLTALLMASIVCSISSPHSEMIFVSSNFPDYQKDSRHPMQWRLSLSSVIQRYALCRDGRLNALDSLWRTQRVHIVDKRNIIVREHVQTKQSHGHFRQKLPAEEAHLEYQQLPCTLPEQSGAFAYRTPASHILVLNQQNIRRAVAHHAGRHKDGCRDNQYKREQHHTHKCIQTLRGAEYQLCSAPSRRRSAERPTKG